ncbi:MAG: hypothetical protein CVU79_06705 [Elusimicrobia bacterium HGW-Elusimicrobia-3]|jgi:hypothetical protein|nr:MAG: hypothetical protein CVU79_06705 [Elusimicrobia bacterium HGW-Elusimicrobia-3]
MVEATAKTYENPLKRAYSVRYGDKLLAITDTSCYSVAEEAVWLAGQLPQNGRKPEYASALARLGINEPEKILEKLLAIGALTEKPEKTWKTMLGAVFSPSIRLVPAQLQERFLNLFGLTPERLKKIFPWLVWLALAGALPGLWLFAGGGDRMLPAAAFGSAKGFLVLALVLLGSMVHELGHSIAAATSGIGLRPIGFSVYLVYPVFYTNVSGVDRLPLEKRALVDCGGFILQSIYTLMLLVAAVVLGSPSAAEAVRWTMLIMLFNLNPLLRTDGYWLYKDTYSALKHKRWMRAVHYVYLVAFVAFSVYFLRFVWLNIGHIWTEFGLLWNTPAYFMQGGYKVVMGAYFAFIGLFGGVRRFQEGKKELNDLLVAARG